MAGAPLAEAFVQVALDASGTPAQARTAGTTAGRAFGSAFDSSSHSTMTRDSRGRFVAAGAGAKTGGTTAGRSFGSAFGAQTGRWAGAEGRKAGTMFGRAFGGIAGPLVATLGAVALGGFIADSVKLEASYSTTLRQIAVATGAPQAALQQLDETAQRFGASTIYSTNEAAQAMLDLAKGGLAPAEIEAGALGNTLTLAAAGNIDLAAAADTTVAAMGAFNLTGKESRDVTTALAGAANESTANVSGLAQSLAQAGGEANAAGFSVAETAGFLGLLADEGIRGSDAGTSVRTMLMRLVPQSKEAAAEMDRLGLSFVNSRGEFVNATTIASRLQDTFKGMSDEERSAALTTIFGADARRAANALIDGGESALRRYIAAAQDTTAAEDMAQANMDGTAGAIEKLGGAWENLKLEVGRGLSGLIEGGGSGLADWINDLDPEEGLREFSEWIKGVGDDLSPLVENTLPAAADVAGDVAEAIGDVVEIGAKLLGWIGDLPGGLQQFALWAGLGAVAVYKLNTAMATGVKGMTVFGASLATSQGRLLALQRGAAVAAGAAGIGLFMTEIENADSGLQILKDGLAGMLVGGAFGGLHGAAIGGAVGGIVGLTRALKANGDAAEEAGPKVADYSETLNDLTGASTRATRALVAQTLQENGVLDYADRLGISTALVTDATLGRAGAEKQLNAELQRSAAGLEAYERQLYLNGAGTAEVIRKTATWRRDLNDLRDAVGANREQLRGDIQDKRQLIEATRGGIASTKDYKAAIEQIPKQARTAIEQEGMEIGIKRIDTLAQKYKLTPKQVNTLVKALGLEQAYADANGYNSALDRLARTVVTHVQTVYTSRGNTGQQGPQVPNANGAIWEAYAGGGMRENHTAQIAKAGAMRLWAEPETGGEAYIPFALSKRSRSLAIWAETGRRLGVAGYAEGGTAGGRSQASEERAARVREQERVLRELQRIRFGLRDDARAVRSEFAGIIREVKSAFGKDSPIVEKLGKISDDAVKAAEHRDRVAKRLDDATTHLRDLVQSRRQLVSSTASSFTADPFGEQGAQTAQGMRAYLRNELRETEEFETYEKILIRKGLSRPLIRQLVGAGPDALAKAKALAALSPDELESFSNLARRQSAAARRVGNRAGAAIYDGRIDAAQGVVANLRRERAQITRELERYAAAAARAVSRAMGNEGDRGRGRGEDDKPRNNSGRTRGGQGGGGGGGDRHERAGKLFHVEHMHVRDGRDLAAQAERRLSEALAVAGSGG